MNISPVLRLGVPFTGRALRLQETSTFEQVNKHVTDVMARWIGATGSEVGGGWWMVKLPRRSVNDGRPVPEIRDLGVWTRSI